MEIEQIPGPVPELGKSYGGVLESVDEILGSVHLRANFQLSRSGIGLLTFVDESLKTEQVRKNPVPVQVLFGPFEIFDRWGEVPWWYHGQKYRGSPRRIDPPADYSESAPLSTQADVLLTGDSWRYPFDKYLIIADVNCDVFATPDRKDYFRILGNGYTLNSKIPNMLVRNPKAKDVGFWIKAVLPDADPKKYAQAYRADMWRDGRIVLVLERPLFPKFFAVFFGAIALAWIVIIAMSSDSKQLSLNVLGYFLAIWAIRIPLAVGAPKVTTLMDYVTLGLYALLVAVALAKFIWGFRKT